VEITNKGKLQPYLPINIPKNMPHAIPSTVASVFDSYWLELSIGGTTLEKVRGSTKSFYWGLLHDELLVVVHHGNPHSFTRIYFFFAIVPSKLII
jgi:hypothetical protein